MPLSVGSTPLAKDPRSPSAHISFRLARPAVLVLLLSASSTAAAALAATTAARALRASSASCASNLVRL
jgi:hypothetical protein